MYVSCKTQLNFGHVGIYKLILYTYIHISRIGRHTYVYHLKCSILFGFTLTPLTVNKMVCLYFYHPGGAPWFSWFFVFLFLVHFYVFLRAFSGAVFPCFLSCFFWCLLVILLVVFFVLFRVLFPLYSGAFFRACPFSFLYMFPLGGGPVFCRAFFGGFWVLFPCFFPCFFSCFFSVFFLCLLSCFFSCIFSFFLVLFFVLFFFVPWAAPKTSNHNILHFGPCFFWCFFWWSLLVKIGNTQYIIFTCTIQLHTVDRRNPAPV